MQRQQPNIFNHLAYSFIYLLTYLLSLFTLFIEMTNILGIRLKCVLYSHVFKMQIVLQS